jgi:hypothetical protein
MDGFTQIHKQNCGFVCDILKKTRKLLYEIQEEKCLSCENREQNFENVRENPQKSPESRINYRNERVFEGRTI